MKTFDRDWDPVHGFLVPAEQILAAGAATYFATVGSILVLAAIFTLIAPMFGATRDYLAALKVATYGAIPVMLAGATLFLPVMAIVAMVGLCHTLFLFWLGVRRVLNVPRGAAGRVRRHLARAADVPVRPRRRRGQRDRAAAERKKARIAAGPFRCRGRRRSTCRSSPSCRR